MVKPLSPDRFMTEADYLLKRIEEIKRLINKLWPEFTDAYPWISSHYEKELDRAILLLKRRKNQHIKIRPKKARGGQVKWGEGAYKMLLIIDKRLHETEKLTRSARIERLSEIFGIGYKKIEERLKLARESVKV